MQRILENSEENELNNILDEIEYIGNEISNLREVTYTYIDLGDGKYFNETFFSDFLGEKNTKESIELSKKNDLVGFGIKLKEKVEIKINNYLGLIDDLKIKINNLNIDNKNDILSAVEVFIYALDFTKTAINFELEKAGLISLSQSEVLQLTKMQNINDENLFGKKVSENKIYLRDNYFYLYKKFFINKNNYTEEEKKNMKSFLKIIENKINDLGGSINLDDLKLNRNELNNYQKEFQRLKKINIKRENYKEMFDLFFDLMEVPQRSKIGNYSSFYDGDNVYGIPSNDKYVEKNMGELINLFFHESTHYINAKVSKDKKLPKLPGDILKEEGIAMIGSELVMGKKLENIDYITKSFPDVIMSQLLNGAEFKKFFKLHRPEVNQDTLFNRYKRGYSKNEGGAYNKDASYPIGMNTVLEYLKSGKPLKNLYSGKVGFDKVESGEYIPKDFGNKFLYPLIMSEFIIFYSLNRDKYKNDGNIDSFNLDFIKRLKNKYSDFEQYFDLFNETEIFTKLQKRKLLKIISYTK